MSHPDCLLQAKAGVRHMTSAAKEPGELADLQVAFPISTWNDGLQSYCQNCDPNTSLHIAV